MQQQPGKAVGRMSCGFRGLMLLAFQETMRFKPVASTGTTRVTKRDLQIGCHTIPANTLVICPFDAVHHSSLNWEDAQEFKPVSHREA